MTSILLVGAGGFVGAVTRYLLDERVTSWTGGGRVEVITYRASGSSSSSAPDR